MNKHVVTKLSLSLTLAPSLSAYHQRRQYPEQRKYVNTNINQIQDTWGLTSMCWTHFIQLTLLVLCLHPSPPAPSVSPLVSPTWIPVAARLSYPAHHITHTSNRAPAPDNFSSAAGGCFFIKSFFHL